MELQDGTYLKLSDNNLVKIETDKGYWVAEKETSLFDAYNGTIIGVWNDKDTGKLWVDKSRYFEDLETALFWAKLFDQLAIWDNANQKEIRL
jgi:hypothetical protein